MTWTRKSLDKAGEVLDNRFKRAVLGTRVLRDLLDTMLNSGARGRWLRRRTMRRRWLQFALAVFLVFSGTLLCGCPATEFLVIFPDPNLELAVRDALRKHFGLLTVYDLQNLITLNARERGIGSLSGLERCTFLTWLDLDTNRVSDLTPLAGLVNLEYLNLDSNQITDISPLVGLYRLRGLSLFDNQVADIGPLVTNVTSRGAHPDATNFEYVILDASTMGVDPDDGVVTQTELDIAELETRGVNVILATEAGGR